MIIKFEKYINEQYVGTSLVDLPKGIRLNLLSLSRQLGGIYNVVNFLIEMTKKYNNYTVEYGGRFLQSPEIQHYNINGICFCDNKYSLNIGSSKIFNNGGVLINFIGIDDDFKKIMYDWKKDKENRKELLKIKMKEIDPYGEEDWDD